MPNKFYPLDIDYGADEDNVKMLDSSAGLNSKLAKEIQDIIKLIFDIENMKKAMLEFEVKLDSFKWPCFLITSLPSFVRITNAKHYCTVCPYDSINSKFDN